MQNPVENLEPGTRLVFTVKDQSTEVVPNGRRPVAGGGDVQELGWGMIHVNRSTMNSQVGVVDALVSCVVRIAGGIAMILFLGCFHQQIVLSLLLLVVVDGTGW